MTPTLGGRRPNAGRKSAFGSVDPHPFQMVFTPDGRRALRRLEQRTGLTRNNVLARLVEAHADTLAFDASGVVYPGKVPPSLAIRLPPALGDRLKAAQARTGKSWSDLGEALVRRFGEDTAYPRPPVGKRARPPAPARRLHGIAKPEAWLEGRRIEDCRDITDRAGRRWRRLTLDTGTVVEIRLTHPWLILDADAMASS